MQSGKVFYTMKIKEAVEYFESVFPQIEIAIKEK